MPIDVQVTVLADRGFGDTKLYDFLKIDLGFDFVIRFRGNISVSDKRGEKRNAQDWVGAGGRAKTLRYAKVTEEEYEVPVVVCVKAKNMKQTWCIAASNENAVASELIRWYSKRWGIEIYQPYCLHKNQVKVNLPFLPANDKSIVWVDPSLLLAA